MQTEFLTYLNQIKTIHRYKIDEKDDLYYRYELKNLKWVDQDEIFGGCNIESAKTLFDHVKFCEIHAIKNGPCAEEHTIVPMSSSFIIYGNWDCSNTEQEFKRYINSEIDDTVVVSPLGSRRVESPNATREPSEMVLPYAQSAGSPSREPAAPKTYIDSNIDIVDGIIVTTKYKEQLPDTFWYRFAACTVGFAIHEHEWERVDSSHNNNRYYYKIPQWLVTPSRSNSSSLYIGLDGPSTYNDDSISLVGGSILNPQTKALFKSFASNIYYPEFDNILANGLLIRVPDDMDIDKVSIENLQIRSEENGLLGLCYFFYEPKPTENLKNRNVEWLKKFGNSLWHLPTSNYFFKL